MADRRKRNKNLRKVAAVSANRVICVGIFCVSLTSPPALAAEDVHSGNYWYSRCAPTADVYTSLICSGFIVGFGQGMEAQAAVNKQPEVICIPKGVNYGQQQEIFHRYLANHPETRHLSAGLLYWAAMNAAFPCKKGARQ